MINSNNSFPLKGRTVVITRAENKQAEAKDLFSKFGAKVLDLPALVGPKIAILNPSRILSPTF